MNTYLLITGTLAALGFAWLTFLDWHPTNASDDYQIPFMMFGFFFALFFLGILVMIFT